MSKHALAFGFGGYADLDLRFGEFFGKDYTVVVRFMPQHPYAGAGPLLAENGNGTYAIGIGDYRWGRGGDKTLGKSMLFVQVGGSRTVYEVTGFHDDVGGPIGYRNVWQHLAVVRDGSHLRMYLNGELLPVFNAVGIPSLSLPSSHTTLRLGRRTRGVNDDSRFWQFYGLMDDVGVFSRALTNEELEQLAAAHNLTGNEDGLLAGYTFGDVRRESHPAVLSRPVTLATAADVSRYVNDYASHPVPVHYVEVSANRDSHIDATMMEIRPSKVQTKPPFAAGEWWRIAQGWEHPAGSHNGKAAHCWDCVRINGPTLGAKIFAAAPGKVSFATQDASGDEHKNAMSVYHTSAERAVYMHLKEGFYSKFFPNGPSLPSDGAIPEQSQPSFEARDPVVEVGHHPNGDHLHFEVADTSDRTFSEDTAGPGVPAAFSDFYLSRDSGESWNKVSLGIPVAGDVIAYYPWSPWSNKGDPLSVAPAVACFGNNHLVVFAKGENDRLWQKTWDGNSWNGDEWSEWRDLGGILTSAPAVASWGPNRLHVFARWEDGHLRHKRWNGKEWSEWRDRGGRLTSAPGAVSWGPNRIDVFVRGHDYQLAHMYWSEGGWSEWRDLDHD